MTPHIKAKVGEIAKTVLMPGDPLRAKYIAENFLDKGFKVVNDVRNMLFFTGTYKGRAITIAASGMGCPSIGIYSYELFKFYGVENIIRIGSAGSYEKDLKLYDILLATSSYSDSNSFAKLVLNESTHEIEGSKILNDRIRTIAKSKKMNLHEGRVHSSDVFYSTRSLENTIKETKSRAVEMESFALFVNAKKLNKNAACILTISDNLITKEETSAEERQNNFTKMMELALELA
ncbi:purine-nucleoside phosphorylase [[Mycoplasma] mobile]|uniref:Uridine phosphorylase n=1 Tax=Mycoplasma mobile (strain ATCC 43663 / 163K / NCTC 11711) TaxID=267748 RepID=Q6KHA9_MYCM1|nr:purine-nucleoside phosphorylase [[Mycoplasma] mobile]AAT28021.1 purine-nucleoside phosphorylase [Mycoplasma mobile 163K]